MKPMRDLIVIEMNVQEKETQKGGLFYQAPRWARPTNIGKVVEVGPEVKSAEVGKYYLINPYSVIDTEDKIIKLVREVDILCQMDDPAKE
jgi:co-chaperonin GroES (HSP10)